MALASMPDRRLWSIVAVSWNYIARQNYLRAMAAASGFGVMIDGGRINLRKTTRKQKGYGKSKQQKRRFKTEWREPKQIIIFEMDERGRMKKGTKPILDGTFTGPDEIMEVLTMRLHQVGASQAEVVAFRSDGSAWIWDRLDWVIRRLGLCAQAGVQGPGLLPRGASDQLGAGATSERRGAQPRLQEIAEMAKEWQLGKGSARIAQSGNASGPAGRLAGFDKHRISKSSRRGRAPGLCDLSASGAAVGKRSYRERDSASYQSAAEGE